MRLGRIVAVAVLLVLATQARAGLNARDLAAVALSPPADAAVPLALDFHDAAERHLTLGQAIAGRPALLLPVDYTCRSLCSPALAIASGALAESGLDPARDFRLVVVGIDPRDSTADARAMSRQIGDAVLENATTLLLADANTIQLLTEAVGYRYEYDATSDQFAHPAGALVITADGRVSRALSSLALNARDLRLALIEAGAGHIGTLGDRLRLLCYGFDAVHGVYTPLITWLMQLLAAITVVGLLAWILLLRRRRLVGGPS